MFQSKNENHEKNCIKKSKFSEWRTNIENNGIIFEANRFHGGAEIKLIAKVAKILFQE
jgi:hypothetical protein